MLPFLLFSDARVRHHHARVRLAHVRRHAALHENHRHAALHGCVYYYGQLQAFHVQIREAHRDEDDQHNVVRPHTGYGNGRVR